MRTTFAFVICFSGLASAACGSTVIGADGSGGETGCLDSEITCTDGTTQCFDTGSPCLGHGGLAPNGCALDAPGATFTFHIHNAGAADLSLTYGCGHTLPITLDGNPISEGPVDACEVDCATVAKGIPNNGCSDCGPGVGAALAPGAVADITWDRRIFEAYRVDAYCSGLPYDEKASCAMGVTFGASSAKAVVTVCKDPQAGGYCLSQDESTISTEVDLTGAEATIDVQ
jgi:hypothetical protein